VEETAVLTLASPPAGPLLLSGFGDIGGFAHDDLNVSPPTQFASPLFNNTNTIDFAGRAPNVVVRSGTPHDNGPTLAYSTDFGRTWSPLRAPPLRGTNAQGTAESRRYDLTGDTSIITSADGSTFIFNAPIPMITRDRGQSWQAAQGVRNVRLIADRVSPRLFYGLDFDRARMIVSIDAGATFGELDTTGLPSGLAAERPTWREAPWPLIAAPDKVGHLWLVSRQGLYRSSDGGRSFGRVASAIEIEVLSFGKAPPGRDYPALFAIGRRGNLRAIWRSDDEGVSWARINDERHEYGRRFRCVAGDPRIFGRVYVGTDGRGIVYGEPRR
jgi:hypothetical protein